LAREASTRPITWRTARLAALAAVVAGAFPSTPWWRVNSSDNEIKIAVARSLLAGDGGSFPSHPTRWAYALTSGRGGRIYSAYSLPTSLVHLPTVALENLGGPLVEGLPWMALLAALAWLLVAWGERSGVSPPAAAVGAILACMGTALWPMAALGYDTTAEVVAMASLLWAGAGKSSAKRWLTAGAVFGVVLATRTTAVILLPAALVLALLQLPRDPRSVLCRILWALLGALPGVALALAYNYHRFGSPLDFKGSPLIPGVPPAEFVRYLVPLFSRAHLRGFAGLLVSPGKGVLWYSPPLVLALLLGVPLARRFPSQVAALATFAVAAPLFYGTFVFWHGDWHWGPRYVAPIFLAAAPVGWLAYEWVTRRGAPVRWLALLAAVAAVAFQAMPVANGEPVHSYLEVVIQPLREQGRLLPWPRDRQPTQEEQATVYFALENSPLWAVARANSLLLDNPTYRAFLMVRLAITALAPVCVGAILIHIARRRGTGAPGPEITEVAPRATPAP